MWTLALYDALATLLLDQPWPDATLPPIQHLDLYYGQYDEPENFLPFPSPAVFLGMTEEGTPAGWGSNQLAGTLEVHLVHKVLENTARNNARLPDTYRHLLRLPRYLAARLQHHEGALYGKLQYLRTDALRKLDAHYVHIITFQVPVRDNLANYLYPLTGTPETFDVQKDLVDEL